MNRRILLILALSAVVHLSLQVSLPTDPNYTAGVVEFRSASGLTSEARITDSLNGYIEIISSEDAKNVDIIVFPESTLNSVDQTTFVPNPTKEVVVPCNTNGEYHNILVQLSCAAKNHTKYLVINLTEKELCSSVPEDKRPCASNGLNIFNTNVVFDRSGAVISRYRKVNLFGENKNTTLVPEFGWFDTDFGVRFGHFICFDILFYSPAQEMAVSHGIKDFILNSMWFSQLPFLTAVQVHQAWSYANNVNLLAAGASNPSVGSTGSGIYNGRHGYLVSKMNLGIGERKLYASQVPKYPSHRNVQKRSLPDNLPPIPKLPLPSIYLKRDYLQAYESVQVNLTSGTSLEHELCFTNTSFCCNFELKWRKFSTPENSKYYRYRLGVYDGMRWELGADDSNYLKNCAVFTCIGDDITDCGKVGEIDTDVIFENITITATFPVVKEYLLMPNGLMNDLLPLPVSNFEWHQDVKSEQHSITYILNTTTSNVLTFSIYGNYYDTEFPEEAKDKGDGVASLAVSITVVFIIVLLNLIL